MINKASFSRTRLASSVLAMGLSLAACGNPALDAGDTHGFSMPLTSTTTPSNQNQDVDGSLLHSTLSRFRSRADADDLSVLESYVGEHPHSPWVASLAYNLGVAQLHEGRFTPAIASFRLAWERAKADESLTGREVADSAIAQYALMNARIGRKDAVEATFQEIANRPMSGAATEMMRGVHEGVGYMRANPGRAFRCGPYAVETIARLLMPDVAIAPPEQNVMPSTSSGTSLAQLADYANQLDVHVQIAKRSPGAEIIAPAVVHWKLGHFGAITEQKAGKWHLVDPTFQTDIWMLPQTIDEEASGYALVPSGPLPAGWHAVAAEEAAKVWGKGQVSAHDPGATSYHDRKVGQHTCGSGMAGYSFHASAVSLNVEDTPVKFDVPFGPEVAFRLTYNQRESAQPAFMATTFGNTGPKWTNNWTAWVEDDPTSPTALVFLHGRGGGYEDYSGLGTTIVSSSAPQQTTQAVLNRYADRFERVFPDGSREVYSLSDGSTIAPRRTLLTAVFDAQGNGVTLGYVQGTLRLHSITDATGGNAINIAYRTDNPNLIDSISDTLHPASPTKLAYETGADNIIRLKSITDPVGIVSSFSYDGSANAKCGTVDPSRSCDFMNSLTTPYGVTNFTTGTLANTVAANHDASLDYYLQATDPEGDRERLEFALYTAFDAVNQDVFNPTFGPPASMPAATNSYLYFRNSFFWDKKAMLSFTGQTTTAGDIQAIDADLAIATVNHWPHQVDLVSGNYVAGTQLESLKVPGAAREYYLYQNTGYVIPTNIRYLMTQRGRVLDNGHDQVETWTYNDLGNVTSYKDPIGRQTNYVYAPNGLDIMQQTQQSAAGTTATTAEITGRWQYPTNAADPVYGKHLATMAWDASGQLTTFAYDAHGRILQSIGPDGTTTRHRYYSDTVSTSGNPAAQAGRPQAIDIQPSGGSFATKVLLTYGSNGMPNTSTQDSDDPSLSYPVAYTYDALDRLLTTTFPDKTQQVASYALDLTVKGVRTIDSSRQILGITSLTDRNGHTTLSSYNGVGQKVTQIDPLKQATTFTWCKCGKLVSFTDPRSNTTQWMYDLAGRALSKTYPDMSQEIMTYEARSGRLHSVTDARGVTATMTYNDDDTLAGVTYSDKTTPSVSYQYDPVYARVKSRSDALGETDFAYNAVPTAVGPPVLGAGQVGAAVAPNEISTFGYDSLGRLTSQSLDGATDATQYDGYSRLFKVTNPLGTFQYGYEGTTARINAVAMPQGLSLSKTSLTAVADFRPNTVNYTTTNAASLFQWQARDYQSAGNLLGWSTSVALPAGAAPRSTPLEASYDADDRLTKLSGALDAPAYIDLLAYDAAGNLSTRVSGGLLWSTSIGGEKLQRRRVGQWTAATAPPLAPGATIRQTDSGSQYTGVVSSDGSIYRFDGASWQTLPGLALDISIGWDGSTWVCTAAGETAKWNGTGWDTLPGSPPCFQLDVGADGTPWVANHASQLWHWTGSAWTLDPTVLSLGVAVAADGTVYTLSWYSPPYTDATCSPWLASAGAANCSYLLLRKRPGDSGFTTTGVRMRSIDAGLSEVWATDVNNEVWRGTDAGFIDQHMSARNVTWGGVNTKTIAFNSVNQCSSPCSFDAAGNQTADDSGKQFTWDAVKRLTKVVINGASKQYTYDGEGRLIRAVVTNSAGVVSSDEGYVWIGEAMRERRNNLAQGAVDRLYLTDGMFTASGGLITSYTYLRDPLGSVRKLVGSDGSTLNVAYDALGAPAADDPSFDLDTGFAGYFYDAWAGLYFTRHRVYDPGQGRFLSRDPIQEAGGANLYAYANDNFLNRVDPSGWASPPQAQSGLGEIGRTLGKTACVLLAIGCMANGHWSTGKGPSPDPANGPRQAITEGNKARKKKDELEKQAEEAAKKAQGGKDPNPNSNPNPSCADDPFTSVPNATPEPAPSYPPMPDPPTEPWWFGPIEGLGAIGRLLGGGANP